MRNRIVDSGCRVNSERVRMENLIKIIIYTITCSGLLMYFLSYIEMVDRINEMDGMLRDIKKDLKK